MNGNQEKAVDLFSQGYNCAQAVLGAFDGGDALSLQAALRLSSSFGGGMAQMREVCGAVCGMFMVMGLQEGCDTPASPGQRQAFYGKLQRMAGEFEEKTGGLLCRDLLKKAPDPENHRPYCVDLVACAAGITAKALGMEE